MYLYLTINNNTMKKQVKILGQIVTVGSKKWEVLTQQVKLFNQLAEGENGN